MLSRFYLKSFKLVAINIMTIGLYFIAQPFLRKMYTPEDFGFYDMVIKSAVILSSFLSLRLEKLIPSEKQTTLLYNKIFGLVFFLFFLLVIFSFPLKLLYAENIISQNIWLIIFLSLLITINQVLKLITIDKSKTNKFGISSFIKRLVEVSTNFSFIKYGLIPGEITGNLSSIFYLRKKIKISFSDSINYLISNKKNVIFNFLPELMIALSAAIPTFIIFQKFDLTTVGIFEMTEKFIYLPLVLVANPMGYMILDFFSKNSLGENNKVFFRILSTNLLLSIIMGLIIYYSVSYFVNEFFGNEWSEASTLVKILIPFLILRLIISPFGQVLVAKRYLKTFTAIQFTRLVLLTALFIPNYIDLKSFIYFFVVSQSAFYLFMILLIIYTLSKHESSTSV